MSAYRAQDSLDGDRQNVHLSTVRYSIAHWDVCERRSRAADPSTDRSFFWARLSATMALVRVGACNSFEGTRDLIQVLVNAVQTLID